MRNLLALLFLALLTFSCAQPEDRVARGGGAQSRGKDQEVRDGRQRRENASNRRFERDWRARYSERTVRKRYGLSKKQLDIAKKRLRKEDPALATESAQNPPGSNTPNQVSR
ncbi:MAG: hypothetical protein JSW03_08875 [Candidatus Eiseniibacteriota bacterium]|nr:MAG: hypothetical protein JSW03_08875 [Candidatus Eisenbacteria bacterium]